MSDDPRLAKLSGKVREFAELLAYHRRAVAAEEAALIHLLECVDSDRATLAWLERVRDEMRPLAKRRRGMETLHEVLAVVESRIEEVRAASSTGCPPSPAPRSSTST